ncbi:MAG: hypothetical protein RMM17_07170 [Acidobacteriota bacterium]|nr:hypothetical protein [Blastocatellia bacterium]MDW8412445.1 hypothetical protein [Acidobacteriota bacterium]
MEAALVFLFIGFIGYGLCILYRVDQLIKREMTLERLEQDRELRAEIDALCDKIEEALKITTKRR